MDTNYKQTELGIRELATELINSFTKGFESFTIENSRRETITRLLTFKGSTLRLQISPIARKFRGRIFHCKHKVDLEEVQSFYRALEGLPSFPLFIVAIYGFTREAMGFARRNNIILITLRDLEFQDLAGLSTPPNPYYDIDFL